MRIQQLMNGWYERRAPVMTDRTRATLCAPMRVIGEQLGLAKPEVLTLNAVERFRNLLLEDGLSRITVARYLAVLRAGCGDTLNHLHIGKLISELKRGPVRVDCWTQEEVAKLLKVAANTDPKLWRLLYFLFSTGCRRGEALALQAEDVDCARQQIDVHRSLDLSGQPKVGTKWGGARIVPMSSALAFQLGSWRCEQGPVFGAESERNWTRRFHSVRALSRVRPFKLHCTRHTAISMALSNGMPLRKAAEIFGVSQQIIEKHYAHFVPSEVPMNWMSKLEGVGV